MSHRSNRAFGSAHIAANGNPRPPSSRSAYTLPVDISWQFTAVDDASIIHRQ